MKLKSLVNVRKIDATTLVIVTDDDAAARKGNKIFESGVVFITWWGKVGAYDWSALDNCEVVVWCRDESIEWDKIIQGADLYYLSKTIDASEAMADRVKWADRPRKAVEIKVHGLVGEIADWMTRTAWRPQPKLSLSAALVLVGYLKGRKYITETGVHSNIYAFNVAGSASGKDRPQAALKYVMSRLGVADSLLHPPASGTGFIDALSGVGGHGLCVIDEMAEYIAGAVNKNNTHQKKVLKYWLEAFTSCNTYIDGERRSDASKEKAKRVERPLFCLLGSTTPDSLAASLRGEDIGNGLLNRFLFVQSNDSPRKRKARDFNLKELLPDSVMQRCKDYLKPPEEDYYGLGQEVQVVPFSEEAVLLYDKIDDYYEDECQKLDLGDRLRNLYGRAHEYVGKVALILCDDKEIAEKDVIVANEIILESVKTALSFCGDITDTREEEDYVRVKNIIKKAKKISAWDLCAKTQRIQGGARRRNEILDTLVESGLVSRDEIKTSGRPNITYFWK